MQQHSDSVSALDLNSQEQEQCVDCQTISCEVETDTRCWRKFHYFLYDGGSARGGKDWDREAKY